MRDEEFRSYVLEQRSALLRTATLLAAGDAHQAEDLVQTTLTRLYVAWPRFRAADSPAAYARRVLVNALVDETRRPWRRREQVRSELPEPASAESVEAGWSEELDHALGELPARMRAAVVLRYFDDLSVAETALLLDCTQATVRSQVARALGKLRGRLGSAITLPEDDPPTSVHVPAPARATTLIRSTR